MIIGRNEKGKPSKILEIIEDIHDLKRKTLQISEQQNLIEKISTLIPEFIYLKDYNTRNKLDYNFNKSLNKADIGISLNIMIQMYNDNYDTYAWQCNHHQCNYY